MVRIGELVGPDMPRILSYLKEKHGEPIIVRISNRQTSQARKERAGICDYVRRAGSALPGVEMNVTFDYRPMTFKTVLVYLLAVCAGVLLGIAVAFR
jgi:hypothetical protein